LPDVSSLTEAFALLILVAPGFVSLRILTFRGNYEFLISDLQTTLWSLMISAINYIPLSFIFHFTSISDLEQKILQPEIIGIYFGIAVGIGFGVGEALRRIRKGVVRESVWIKFAYTNVGDWVHIHTNKDQVYRGWIKLMSALDAHKREVELADPEVLEITNNVKSWKSVGQTILFTENDVARIVLMK